MIVTMYTHRLISLGAQVTAMIETMGDESFVMLAMIPKETIMLTGILIVIGILFGIITDYIFKDYKPGCWPFIQDIHYSYLDF